MIPKTIHYCWFGRGEMSPLHKACVQSWKDKLPDYEIKLWDESNVDMKDPFVAHYYKAKQWAFVSDYVRLKKVYEYGGIYLDTDMEVVKPFGELLTQECFFGYESEDFITSGAFGSEKRNDFVGECIDFMLCRHDANKPFLVAPQVITRSFEAFNNKPSVYLCPVRAFYPFNPYVDDIKQLMYQNVRDDTYAIHHWAKTWEMSFFFKVKRRIQKILFKD
jgi:hypothetical protein